MSKNAEYKGQTLRCSIAEEHIEAMSSQKDLPGELKEWTKIVHYTTGSKG